jgi:hypothetical protein
MSQTEEAVPLDKLTRVYMKMRAKMQEIEAEYEAKIDSLKEQQKEVKNAIKDLMLAQGSKSVRTDYGTHQGNMAKFLEENPSLLPPGLNSDTEFDVSVRKPSTK